MFKKMQESCLYMVYLSEELLAPYSAVIIHFFVVPRGWEGGYVM